MLIYTCQGRPTHFIFMLPFRLMDYPINMSSVLSFEVYYLYESDRPFHFFFLFLISVNLISGQTFQSSAAIMLDTKNEAGYTIDGNTNTCAVGVIRSKVWWKVWLERQFNIAYIEIYFKPEGKLCV